MVLKETDDKGSRSPLLFRRNMGINPFSMAHSPNPPSLSHSLSLLMHNVKMIQDAVNFKTHIRLV